MDAELVVRASAVALESDVADFNHTADKYDFSAGSVTAALFLEKFVGDEGVGEGLNLFGLFI